MKKILFALTISVLFILNVYSQIDRSVEPKAGPGFNISIPKIERAELPNGLKIIVVEHTELPIIQMQLVVHTGADADAIEKAGVASMTAEMFDEGTKSRNALKIADDLDFIGASVATSANYDGSFAGLLTLKEKLNTAMNIFSDVVLNPVFPDSEFNRIKSELLADLVSQKVQPEIVASNVFNLKLFGEKHPYSRNIDGTEETVSGISLQDLKDYYEKYFLPNNSSLIVVGDITKKDAVDLIQKYFGKWKKRALTLPELLEPLKSEGSKIFIVNKDGAPQSQIIIGNVGIRRSYPDFYAVNILNQILGASNGRLYLNLREAHAYTYGAYANFSMRKVAGPFMAYAGVKTDVTDSALIEFMKEINRLRDELVPEEEFEMYKTAVIQRLPRVFETPAQIASQLLSLELFNLPDDFFSGLIDNYQKVTREDIQRVAQKYMTPNNLTIVIVGDEKSIKEKIAKLHLGSIILCDEKGKEL